LRQNSLISKSVPAYLKELNRIYPNWRPYEELSAKEKADNRIVRNLEAYFWENVKEGNVDFPVLPGQWMGVETIQKPYRCQKYPATALTDIMRLSTSEKVLGERSLRDME